MDEMVQVAHRTLRHARRLVILVIGGTVVLLGLALLALPGPGVATIIAGLALLATEFIWARTLLKRARARAQSMFDAARRMCGYAPPSAPPAQRQRPGPQASP